MRALLSPPALLAFVGVILMTGAYLKGFEDARLRCEEAALRTRVAALERDVEIARRAEERAKDQAEAIRRLAQQNEEKIDALTAELEALPSNDVCRIGDADARRLRDIR